jgi:hypothetical protein
MRATLIKFIAFMAVCACFTVYLAFTIGNIRPSHLWFFHKDYSLNAYFDDVTGLNVGDNVKVAGVIVGKVKAIHLFAQSTSLLSQERGTIAGLVHNLSDTATNALDLVAKHGTALQHDITTLTRLLASLNANLDAVSKVLSSAPILTSGQNLDSKSGLVAAYNPQYHRIDLRTQTATAQLLLAALGFPVCPNAQGVPQTGCPSGTTSSPTAAQSASTGPAPGASGPAANAPAPTTTTTIPCPTAPPLLPTTTTTTTAPPPQPPQPCPTIPPVTVPPPPPLVGGVPAAPTVPTPPGIPDIAVSPLSPVMTLLGSPGAAGPISQSAYGLTPGPAPVHHHGVFGCIAQWSHDALENLW